MTADKNTTRAFLAGILSGRLMRVEGCKVVRAHIDRDGAPPCIRLEIEGHALEVAVLSAEPLDGEQRTAGR